MITIGVTGGVGAGKSEILRHLAEHYNSRILMSDNAAKDLEKPGGPLYEPLVSLLESEESAAGSTEPLLMPDKEINKAEMARRIFADAGLLKKINELVHPASWSQRSFWKTDTIRSWTPCGISTAMRACGHRGSRPQEGIRTRRSARS